MNDILADQNDINESTRMQLDAISIALAELQAKPTEAKPRKPIGFIQPEENDEEDKEVAWGHLGCAAGASPLDLKFGFLLT